MQEIWKDIKGYEGKYQVSNLGNVKSLNYHREQKEKLLLTEKNQLGYVRVMLCKESKIKAYLVHRLVANAFIPNVNNLPHINHKDENKENNTADNLEWCNQKYNVNYGTRSDKISQKVSKPVLQYDKQGNLIKKWNSATEAAKNLNINVSCICRCCKGNLKTSKGYKWKYLEKTS